MVDAKTTAKDPVLAVADILGATGDEKRATELVEAVIHQAESLRTENERLAALLTAATELYDDCFCEEVDDTCWLCDANAELKRGK